MTDDMQDVRVHVINRGYGGTMHVSILNDITVWLVRGEHAYPFSTADAAAYALLHDDVLTHSDREYVRLSEHRDAWWDDVPPPLDGEVTPR